MHNFYLFILLILLFFHSNSLISLDYSPIELFEEALDELQNINSSICNSECEMLKSISLKYVGEEDANIEIKCTNKDDICFGPTSVSVGEIIKVNPKIKDNFIGKTTTILIDDKLHKQLETLPCQKLNVGMKVGDFIIASIDKKTINDQTIKIIKNSLDSKFWESEKYLVKNLGNKFFDHQIQAIQNLTEIFKIQELFESKFDPIDTTNEWDIIDGNWNQVQDNESLYIGKYSKNNHPENIAGESRGITLLDIKTTDCMSIEVDFESIPIGHDYWNNAFIIFDYQNPNNYKYSGANINEDKWVIESVDIEAAYGPYLKFAQFEELIETSEENPPSWYHIELFIENNKATLFVDDDQKVSYNFGTKDFERTYIGTGKIGLSVINAQARFKNFKVSKKCSPETLSKKNSIIKKLIEGNKLLAHLVTVAAKNNNSDISEQNEKINQSIKYLADAEDAFDNGNYKLAITLFKKAWNFSTNN